MPRITPRGKLRFLIHTCLATSFALPLAVQAQQGEPEVEEVVVTGSYIRNSAFAQNSPVDTVSQTDLFESGAPSMSAYIRDLSYTQNTNAVNVVLGSQDGAQSGISTSFNLRGLGENSTLTLIDGARTLSPAMQASLPEIALARMELVLDGGSALYGSDAVAGVVNLIPVKEFDGFRARTYYQRTEDGAMEDMTASMMWGRSFNNGVDYVGAFEVKARTPLMMYERTREWQHSNNSSTSGSPGSFREITNVPDEVMLYQLHGGVHVGSPMVDPSCETFNQNSPAHGAGMLPEPSGTIRGSACTFEYSMQHPYSRHEKLYNLYNSVSFEATDWLRFNATLNNHFRFNDNRTTSTSPNGGNDRGVALIRADHPANPYGVDVTPWAWRPFGASGTLPSHFNTDSSRQGQGEYSINRFKLNAEYDISDTWTGYTYFSRQDDKTVSDVNNLHTARLQLALLGMGGPNGNEYFNPFGSNDPRSPYYIEGVTNNTQEMVDWLWYFNDNFTTGRNELDVFETLLTGELFDVPAGTVQTAIGYQWRDSVIEDFAEPHEALGANYQYTAIGSPLPVDQHYVSEVRSVFGELQVPVLETLDAQLAVRHEQFKDFGLEATTPKISLRWEALPELALRASWGESFLAPTPIQSRPFIPNENCGDMWSGRDEMTNTLLIGGTYCSSGNPNLRPESSTIQNIGFTWEPTGALDGLNLSVDYQEIEYVDRIRTLSQQDTVAYQFTQFLEASGYTAANYDPTPGSASRNAADAWLAAQAGRAGNPIVRYPDGSVERVFTQAANVSSVWIDLIDLKAQYTIDTQDLGSFTTTVQSTYYTTYEYEALGGGVVKALGKQNADSGVVPPLPELKLNVRLNWFRNNQSASISGNYWNSIEFDGQVVDLYPQDGINTAPSKVRGEYIFDARYAMVFDQYFDSEFTVSAGINNLFDKRPQRMGIIGGAETRLSSPWGRQFWLSLEWSPGF